MEFATPLYGLLALPVALILLLKLRGERNRRNDLRRFAEPHLLERLVKPEGATRKTSRLLLPTLVMLLLVVALMRPQWGVIEEERSTSGLDILFAIDLSRSMLADDLSPTRLAVARKAVYKALESMPGDRAGIVGFAGTAFLVCPLTSDREMLTRVLEELGTGTLPKGGSSIASALKEAKRGFRGTAPGGRILVLLSDGEDHVGEIGPALADLRTEGVTVLASVVGTLSGGLMPLPDGTFVKDRQGAVVKSRTDIAALKLIDPSASAISADGSGLGARIAAIRTTSRETVRKERRHRLAEHYGIPLSAALFIWCLGMACPGRRFLP